MGRLLWEVVTFYPLAGLGTLFFGVVVFGARLTLRQALFAFLCWPYCTYRGAREAWRSRRLY